MENENTAIVERESTTLMGGVGAEVRDYGNYYKVKAFGNQARLERDIDFGVIPNTKQPSLYKSGAEKIINVYGMLPRFEIESKVEDFEKPFFHYVVKCSLVKIANNGQEYVFATGYGSANTLEKQVGRATAFDAANSRLKMAQKRALVQVAITISGLSSMFTQDMENETFMENYAKIVETQDPESFINAKQIKRLFAMACAIGLTAPEAKKELAKNGIKSVKEIKQKDYAQACDIFRGGAENEENSNL